MTTMDKDQLLFSCVPPRAPRAPTPRERFEKFHHDNPNVYRRLLALASKVKRAGHPTYGIMALYGVVRFQLDITTHESPKLPNGFMPFYARLLMEENRELKGLFVLRKSVADEEATWASERAN